MKYFGTVWDIGMVDLPPNYILPSFQGTWGRNAFATAQPRVRINCWQKSYHRHLNFHAIEVAWVVNYMSLIYMGAMGKNTLQISGLPSLNWMQAETVKDGSLFGSSRKCGRSCHSVNTCPSDPILELPLYGGPGNILGPCFTPNCDGNSV
jgi:hypothetical protein